jgi:hypothetical protein
MRGASLRSVAELLGHQSVKMTMRYAPLSPAYLSAEVGLLDPPNRREISLGRKWVKFPKENGSSGWIRTSNPPVNSPQKGENAPSGRFLFKTESAAP